MADLLVAVGDRGEIHTSPDGITWTKQGSGVSVAKALRGVAKAPGGNYVAVGTVAPSDPAPILSSPDGVAWTQRHTVSQSLLAVAWGGGLFVAVGENKTLLTSPDAITWTARDAGMSAIPDTSDDLLSIAYANGLFVAGGQGGNYITSPDGITWTARTLPSTADRRGVAYGVGLWVIVGESGDIYTSASGTGSWSRRTNPLGASTMWAVTFGSLFVVVGDQNQIATSPDGITWTARTSPLSATSVPLAAGHGNGVHLVGATGGGLVTSPDGVTWTSRTSGTSEQIYALTTLPPNQSPNAPTLTTLVDGSTVDINATNRAAHQFNDPDTGDSQSAFDHRYRPIGAATWTSAYVVSPNQWVDYPAGTFADAVDYERQVRTYDALGIVGPWSPSGFFTGAVRPPSPTITDPANGATIGADEHLVKWSTPNQDAYQLQVLDGATVVYDTGAVRGNAGSTARSHLTPYPTNDVTRDTQVRYEDAGLWSAWYTVTNPVSYTRPPTPTLSIAASNSEGAVSVTLTNPTPATGEPAVSYNNMHVRDTSGRDRYRPADGIRFRKELPLNPTVLDHLAASGVNYEYRAEAVGSNGTTALSEWVPITEHVESVVYYGGSYGD